MDDAITAREFHASEGVEDWRVLGEGACAYFRDRIVRSESARFVARDRRSSHGIGGPPARRRPAARRGDRPPHHAGTDDYRGMSRRDVRVGTADLGRGAGSSGCRPTRSAVQTMLDRPGRAGHRRGHAVLARRPRLRAPTRQSGRGPGRSADAPARRSGSNQMDTAASRWRRRDPPRGLGAASNRPRHVSRRRSLPAADIVRDDFAPDVVDARRRCRERSGRAPP